jgi:hypothetical protein
MGLSGYQTAANAQETAKIGYVCACRADLQPKLQPRRLKISGESVLEE